MAGSRQANEGKNSSCWKSVFYGGIEYSFGGISSFDRYQFPEVQMVFGKSYGIKGKTVVMDAGGNTACIGFAFFLWKIRRSCGASARFAERCRSGDVETVRLYFQ